MLASWWQQLQSLFALDSVDDALSREHARNAAARAQLAAARLQHSREENDAVAVARAAEAAVRAQRQAYADEAAPLLATFDELALAQHHYQELRSTLTQQRAIVAQLRERELDHFGYVSKKLTSVALHVEALRACVQRGDVPFARELDALVADADSDDVACMATPLRAFASRGVASEAAVRAAAATLACALANVGTAPATPPPPRRALDWLRFAPSYSPAEVRLAQVQSRQTAQRFRALVDANAYADALATAAAVHDSATRTHDATAPALDDAYRHFRRVVLPRVVAQNLLTYAQASLDASRYACIERMLTE